MAHAPGRNDPNKRRRGPNDTGSQSFYRYQPVVLQHAGLINYLPRPSAQRLPLVEGNAGTFGDLINALAEYEGILDRNESLAARLGAKLTGPRFLKSLENFFEGPIKASPPQPFTSPITWVDIVRFAKANPAVFTTTCLSNGSKCSRFLCRGMQVEITPDDLRLISTGAVDRFRCDYPFEEDEAAELATVEILEQRASALYKKADEVAARARMVHRKLAYRKQELARRCKDHDENSGTRFHAVNDPPRPPRQGQSSYDLHADLLQQFASASAPGPAPAPTSASSSASASSASTSSSTPHSRSPSSSGMSVASLPPLSPCAEALQHNRPSGPLALPILAAGYPSDMASVANGPTASETQSDVYRSLVTQKMERISKGDQILPPCDRCRRLRQPCIKHLTACQGCTKKHARCAWKSLSHTEVSALEHEVGFTSNIQSRSGKGRVKIKAESPRTRPRSRRCRGTARAPGADSPSVTTHGSTPPRPTMRANTDPGARGHFSPATPPSGGSDATVPLRQRTSLPNNRVGGMQPTLPRDNQRMAQISSILSPPNINPNHRPFSYPPNSPLPPPPPPPSQ